MADDKCPGCCTTLPLQQCRRCGQVRTESNADLRQKLTEGNAAMTRKLDEALAAKTTAEAEVERLCGAAGLLRIDLAAAETKAIREEAARKDAEAAFEKRQREGD